eukprot:3119644-Amphidinium_carterae.1
MEGETVFTGGSAIWGYVSFFPHVVDGPDRREQAGCRKMSCMNNHSVLLHRRKRPQHALASHSRVHYSILSGFGGIGKPRFFKLPNVPDGTASSREGR